MNQQKQKKSVCDKIDAVYLWCDGNDPAFRKRKNYYVKDASVDEKTAGEQRFRDNDELKYSLRSLEKFAPWINHVYIITDRQVPPWLNTDYEKVTVVDHSEIMPQEIIPTFNSDVIEYFLPFIPNLAEKFLYANDDMFFGNHVSPDYFFAGDRPIVRLRRSKSLAHKQDIMSKRTRVGICLLEKEYHRLNWYRQHHNIDSYTKTAYLETLARYRDEFALCHGNRFRSDTDITRIIFALDAVYAGKAILQEIKPPSFFAKHILSHFQEVKWDSFFGNETEKTRKNILKYRPKLFCINDNGKNEERENINRFLASLFPTPSQFEK